MRTKREHYKPRDGSSGTIWFWCGNCKPTLFQESIYSHPRHSFRAFAISNSQWWMKVASPRWIFYDRSPCNWFNWSFRSNQLIDPSLTLAILASSNSKMYVPQFPILIALSISVSGLPLFCESNSCSDSHFLMKFWCVRCTSYTDRSCFYTNFFSLMQIKARSNGHMLLRYLFTSLYA